MNNYKVKIIVLAIIAIMSVSCKRTTTEIKETYTDGKPKITEEYITNDNGDKVLYKETRYFPGEKKFISGTYDEAQERNGVWTSWYESGQKNSEQKYINGKEDGVYNVWHPNGKQYIKGKYEMGKKVGVWSFHDSLGVVMKKIDFDLN